MDYLSFLFYLLLIAAKVGAELFFSSPGPYCEGETVNLTCIIQPSSGTFTNLEASFQFNNSATCYGSNSINTDMTGDIDSTRYSHTGFLPGSSLTNATGVLVITPFMAIDATFPFACCGTLGGGLVETFNNTFLRLAAPPFAASINMTTTFDSATSCTGNITLTWLAVTSDKPVTSYAVLLNGSNISTITTPIYSYTTESLNLSNHYANYSITAISSAGSNSSSVIIVPPAPPSNATININTTYDSDINCPITLYWLEVIADRNVTRYEVLLNGTIKATLSPTAGTNTYTTSSMSLATLNGTYTVRAASCAGSSFSNEVVFTPPNVPSTPNITYIAGNSSYIVFSIANTGIIAAYYMHINGRTDMITPNTSGNVYNYTGSLISMYGDYNFSISAGNCVGNSSNSQLVFIIGDVEPSTTTTSTTTSPASTPSPTTTPSGTGNSTNSMPSITLTTLTTTPTSTTTTAPITTTTTKKLNVSSTGSPIFIIVVPIGGAILLLAIILALVIIILIICFYKCRTKRKSSTIRNTFLRESESNIPSQHESSIQMSTVASPPIYSMVDYDAKRSDQKMKTETNKKNEPQLNYADLNFMQKETNFNNSGQNPSESTQYSMVHRSNANEPPTHYTDILKEENPYFTQFS